MSQKIRKNLPGNGQMVLALRPKVKQSVRRKVSRKIQGRTMPMVNYGGSSSVQEIREMWRQGRERDKTLNPGQNTRLKLSILPDANAFASLSASFVIYALTLGYDKTKAGAAFMAIQVLLFNAMSNGVEVLLKAPRIWWQVTNAVRPKISRYRGVEFGFEFNMDTLGINTAPYGNGYIVGAPTGAVNDGLNVLNSGTPLIVPSLMDAADAASDLFNIYQKTHPLINKVNDFVFDPSAFAWRQSLFPNQNPNDTAQSAYSSNNLEVPILSWFGYLGLASNQYDDTVNRIPTSTLYSQGAAGHHAGLRLHNPQYLGRKFVKTGLNLKPVDMESWFFQDCAARNAAFLNLISAGRTVAAGPGPLPATYADIVPNLALIYRVFNFAASMLSYAAMWFGASQRFGAICVGTNNLDPLQTGGLTESFFSIASVRQITPLYNRRSNQVVVPFPVVSDTATATFYAMFQSIALPYYPGTGPPTYGGMNLDLLNSTVGSAVVAWADQSLKDAKQAIKEADAAIQNLIPTSSPVSVMSKASTVNVLVTKILSLGSQEEVLLSGTTLEILRTKIAKRLKIDPTQYQANILKNRAAFYEFQRRSHLEVAKRLPIVEFEPKFPNEYAARAKFIVSGPRVSPDTETGLILALTGETPFDPNHAIETMMQMPIAAYTPVSRATDIDRIVNGGVTAYEPGIVGSQSFVMDNLGTASAFVKDPTSMQGSEATQELLRLSRGLAQSLNLGGEFDNVMGAALPMVRVGGKIVQSLVGIGKNIAARVKDRRAKKRAARRP